LGAIPVALALVDEGCRDFFVAHLAEGLRLSPACQRPPASMC
jgi:alanine racemase